VTRRTFAATGTEAAGTGARNSPDSHRELTRRFRKDSVNTPLSKGAGISVR
jgi:hypothetical protein